VTVEHVTDSQLIKLKPSQLREGMYIARLDRPWLESPFLFQGFPLTTRKELEQIQALCDYVYVDSRKSRPFVRRGATQTLDKVDKVFWQNATPLEDEITQAAVKIRSLSEEVVVVLRRSRIFGEAHIRHLKPHLKACAESLVRNASASLWLGHMLDHDNALAGHAVRVGLLCMVVGRHLGLPRQQLETVGLCGLLHDIGKTVIPRDLPPGEAADRELRKHTGYGRDLLLHDALLPNVVLEAVYSHHEHVDGKGYPEGIGADALSYHTRLVSIADCYDKLCNTEGKTPSQALQAIYRERGRQFDQQLVVNFIEAIGLYPPGSIVELNSGEVGIVLEAGPEARLRPRIALVRDRNKRPIPQFILNLKTVRQDKTELYITRVLADGAFGVSRARFMESNRIVA